MRLRLLVQQFDELKGRGLHDHSFRIPITKIAILVRSSLRLGRVLNILLRKIQFVIPDIEYISLRLNTILFMKELVEGQLQSSGKDFVLGILVFQISGGYLLFSSRFLVKTMLGDGDSLISDVFLHKDIGLV